MSTTQGGEAAKGAAKTLKAPGPKTSRTNASPAAQKLYGSNKFVRLDSLARINRGRGMRKDAAAVALATLRRHEVQSTGEDWEEEEEESSVACLEALPLAKTLVATGAKRVKGCEQGYCEEWPSNEGTFSLAPRHDGLYRQQDVPYLEAPSWRLKAPRHFAVARWMRHGLVHGMHGCYNPFRLESILHSVHLQGYALCLASTKPTLRAETVETREHHPRLEAREHYATLHTTQQPPLQVTSPSSPSNHKEEALALTIGLSVTCLYTSLDTNARHPSEHDHPVRKLPFELVLIGQPEQLKGRKEIEELMRWCIGHLAGRHASKTRTIQQYMQHEHPIQTHTIHDKVTGHTLRLSECPAMSVHLLHALDKAQALQGMFFDVFAAKHDAQVQRVVQVRIV